uniref:Beta-glucan synthesis-associated protein n=1 Tax=Peronospora matthiolae TaxID=2874970 RepID=A0AAV1TT02_9STRA
MVTHGFQVTAAVLAVVVKLGTSEPAELTISSRSGLKPWVDVDTPKSVYNLTSSRGDTWTLVMSDEFNVPGRNFAPGRDHMWTAVEMPDGVNAALEYYSINMTSTLTEPDGRGVFQIKIMEDENITYTVWNNYAEPAGFETHNMYYRAGMIQSWNKFCFQGGRMEVVAQLPATVSSSNPDMKNINNRVESTEFYPTWPGIWLLGNLGRALFSQSTSRMWPWSYNECDKTLKTSQRINACDGRPGHGLNPYQGRGAPEIDLLEGAGNIISTSIQLAPGMPNDFRIIPPTNDADQSCVYTATCKTMGANFPGIPTKTYAARKHNTWYQGLRYAPNTLCTPMGSLKQDADTVIKNMKKGYTSNMCTEVNMCPASGDGYSSLELIDGNGTRHWGINDVGGCMPLVNGYTGAFLCDPDSSNSKCLAPLAAGKPGGNVMEPFEYQMDAISANWPVQTAAYTSYLKYQVEWVMGSDGYVRWMLEDVVMFEIPADAVENVPQDAAKSNPKKIMLEEPMYVIFNVALSTSWGTTPPNPGLPCRGDGSDAQTNAICDGFPMYMKIDYIRIYQDLSPSSTMAIGCDPSTHPTKQWIEDHIDEYETEENKVIEVHGGANCKHERDCTVSTSHVLTGTCDRNDRCICPSNAWGGPRCTTALTDTSNGVGFGPPVVLATPLSVFIIILFGFVAYKITCQQSRKAKVGAGTTRSRGFIKLQMDDIPMSISAPDDRVA